MLETYIERALNSDSNSLLSAHNSCFEVTEKWTNILYQDFLTIGHVCVRVCMMGNKGMEEMDRRQHHMILFLWYSRDLCITMKLFYSNWKLWKKRENTRKYDKIKQKCWGDKKKKLLLWHVSSERFPVFYTYLRLHI